MYKFQYVKHGITYIKFPKQKAREFKENLAISPMIILTHNEPKVVLPKLQRLSSKHNV